MGGVGEVGIEISKVQWKKNCLIILVASTVLILPLPIIVVQSLLSAFFAVFLFARLFRRHVRFHDAGAGEKSPIPCRIV